MALEQNLFLLEKSGKDRPKSSTQPFLPCHVKLLHLQSWKGALRDRTITTEWETGQTNLTRSASQSEYRIRFIIPAVAQPAA